MCQRQVGSKRSLISRLNPAGERPSFATRCLSNILTSNASRPPRSSLSSRNCGTIWLRTPPSFRLPPNSWPNLIDAWRIIAKTRRRSPLGKPFSSGFLGRVHERAGLPLICGHRYSGSLRILRGVSRRSRHPLHEHLDAAFTYIRTFPEIAPLFHGRYRRLLIPHFPYGIFYSLESDRVIIAAVMNLQQNPAVIQRRLG